jgi:hypothetical protein
MICRRTGSGWFQLGRESAKQAYLYSGQRSPKLGKAALGLTRKAHEIQTFEGSTSSSVEEAAKFVASIFKNGVPSYCWHRLRGWVG